jgi:hypothetical protein
MIDFKGQECAEDMGSDPCGNKAVGVRVDPNWGGEYPVCRKHHRAPFPECDHANTHMRGWTHVCDDCGQGREIQ